MRSNYTSYPALDNRVVLSCVASVLTQSYNNSLKLSLPNFYWVDSGRNSLRLFIESQKSRSDLYHVLIPSLTCCVVYDAVVSAGCVPIVYNTSTSNPVGDLNDILSRDISQILCIVTQSTFGFSSLDLAIGIKCHYPAATIIDDRAHGHQDILKPTQFPYDAYFYSFDQSKIFSCYKGGLLVTDSWIDNSLVSKPSLLVDSRDLIFFIASYLLNVAFFSSASLLFYKLLFRAMSIRPSMSKREVELEGLENRPVRLSSLKLAFLYPQLVTAPILYQHQKNYVQRNIPNCGQHNVLCTRVIVSQSVPSCATASNFWFGNTFYPASEIVLRSKGLPNSDSNTGQLCNIVLGRRLIYEQS